MTDQFNLDTLLLCSFAMLYILHGFAVFIRDFRTDWASHRRDLLQPWKLVTLAIGTGWLLWGARTFDILDWDVGVSLIMAGLTYLTAPWCARAVISLRWPLFAGVVITCWFTVDGSYSLWHNIVGNPAYRLANFPASQALFWLCGFIWLPRGSLCDLLSGRAQLR